MLVVTKVNNKKITIKSKKTKKHNRKYCVYLLYNSQQKIIFYFFKSVRQKKYKNQTLKCFIQKISSTCKYNISYYSSNPYFFASSNNSFALSVSCSTPSPS